MLLQLPPPFPFRLLANLAAIVKAGGVKKRVNNRDIFPDGCHVDERDSRFQ